MTHRHTTANTVALTPTSTGDTHEVTNTPPTLSGYNAYNADPALGEALHRENAGWAESRAHHLGASVGNPDMQERARLANRHIPEFRPFDSYGNRVDIVEYHPAYHELMTTAMEAEVHSLAWSTDKPGGHVARAAMSYLWNQVENGVGCPTGMAYAAIPLLRTQPETKAWADKMQATTYDPRIMPIEEKSAITVATTLTEKHGGCDLRANTTTAAPVDHGGAGQAYRLTGHKWFCSAPMGDVFLTTAITPNGPGLFAAPRFLPDGGRNRIFIQGLKEKCGNRSNASSHVEFSDTWALLIGEEGEGIRKAMTDVHYTRLDFAAGSTGLMRQALSQAMHYGRHRRAFQRSLVDLPLMSNILADLALDVEGSLAMCLRIARAVDETGTDPTAALLARIGPPMAKYWCCKRAPGFVAEALECIGGNGYIEDAPMARLYREAPLNGIWEGSSNMVALDVFRAAEREPGSLDAVLAEIESVRGTDTPLDRALEGLKDALANKTTWEFQARRLVERMALLWQAALLRQHASTPIADAFIASRVVEGHGPLFGRLNSPNAVQEILDRALMT
ncbi:MAG: acyl-CoA dehydrogenase family protein [Rhodospirillales bacterium]|nr:acyl-CoA dehydrogenase family protein [Rhodospirillales bacterium]